MDKVFVEGLQVEAVIGIHDWERRTRQPLLFDIEIAFDNRIAAASDAVADTIDYAEVAARIEAVVRDARCQLLETLIEQVAAMILQQFHCDRVVVRIRKPAAIANARCAGIEIHRER